MGASHNDHPVEVDPQALANAHSLWGNFMGATKYGIIAVVGILILMAIFLA